MKIKILYSHLNVTENDYKIRPFWFNFEKCFKNLLSTIPNIELHVIYDTSKGEITNNWINNYTSYFTLHNIQGGTMEKAAVGMYNVAKELSNDMNDDDLFYFLENDYLHINGWVEKIIDLFSSYKGLNYVSLYDHLDKYNVIDGGPDHSDLVSKIITTDSHHWRTTPSACGSYLVSKKIFLEDYIDLITIMGDHNKWIYLQENKNRFLLSPIPGLSTHCMEFLMSPTIEWNEI